MKLCSKSGGLVGREEECETLLALRQQLGSGPSVCLVHGVSGSGKTALCEHLQKKTAEDPGYFATGKFDQYQDFSEPYSALVQAFDSLGNAILLKDNKKDIQDAKDCLCYEGKLLRKLVASFSKLSKEDEPEDSSSSVAKEDENSSLLAAERLAVAIRAFLREFCTSGRPLVLFIDDLQWADSNSQEILLALMNDDDAHHLLIMGGIRDESYESCPVFTTFQSRASRPVTEIHVENLDLSRVNDLVADMLSAETERSSDLADIVFRKTAGNPYFCLQFLEQLQRQGLLKYNFASLQWEWDVTAISAETDVSENVADVISKGIEQLSPEVTRVLKLGSCVGFYLDVDILVALLEKKVLNLEDDVSETTKSSTETVLKLAEEEGFVERKGSLLKFSHDRVQQTAYELLPAGLFREKLHWQIGKVIQSLRSQSKSTPAAYLFLAADQLSRGASCMETDRDRQDLLHLNFEAAKAAQTKSAIELTASFLQKAVDLSEKRDWKDSYDLMLLIHNMSAEVESSRGNFELGGVLVDTVLENARAPQDTLRARAVRAQVLAWQFQFQASISEVRKAIALCGEQLPPSNSFRVSMEFRKVERLLAGKSDDDLVKIPPMTDPLKKRAMQLLKLASPVGWQADEKFFFLCGFRMLELTLRYGHFDETGGYAFATYGCTLSTMKGKESDAFRYSQLSARVTSTKASLPGTSLYRSAFLDPLMRPSGTAMELMLSAYRVALETGDMTFGSICLAVYTDLYKLNGLKLLPHIDDLRKFGGQLKMCRQDLLLAFLLPNLQLALNLSGRSSDPLKISWDVIQKQGLFNENVTIDKNHQANIQVIYNQMFNSYILNDEDSLEKSFNNMLSLKVKRFHGRHVMNYFYSFMDGLAGLSLHSKRKVKKYRKVAHEAIHWLQSAAKSGNVDCVVLVGLLIAEKGAHSSSLRENKEEVKAKFDTAIAQSARGGFVHYGAIANERVGEYMLRSGDEPWGEYYLSQAALLYKEWGASVKVKLLSKAHASFIHVPETGTASAKSSALRGRARYNSIVDTVPAANPHSSMQKQVTGMLSSLNEERE